MSDRLIYNSAMITGQVYHCLNCDYIGSLVLETDERRDGTNPGPKARP